MDKYKKLIYNTLTFGLGTFGSKILTFLMMPFYTKVLVDSVYSTSTLVANVANLLMPIFSLGIASAVIRFGLDKKYDKPTIFTSALISIFAGCGVLFLISPLLFQNPFLADVKNHALLILFYVLFAALKSSCSIFVRSMQYVKLFSLDGVLSTLVTVVLNLVFLGVFKMGVTGYVLSTILGDALSCVFLFFMADLWKYIRFKGLNLLQNPTYRSMLRYSIPLMPTSLFWWITNLSDRFVILQYLSSSINGQYEAASRIPTMIVLVSNIFTEAWQMSAVIEKDSADQSGFFSTVFKAFSSVMFFAASGLILVAKPVTNLLINYPDAWKYVPLLIVATVYNCLATYLGSVFAVKKKSVISMLTVVAGAGSNIALNFLLIPRWGANGAATATLLSYGIVFLMRVLASRNLIRIRIGLPRMVLNTAITCGQAYILLHWEHWLLPCLGLFVLSTVVNLKPLLGQAKTLLARRNTPSLKKGEA